MSKKKDNYKGGLVYSTEPNFKFDAEEREEFNLPPEAQQLKVKLDKKNRGGKIVTLVEGFSMDEESIESLVKKLKTFCGSGGSSKNGEIIIQGDHRDKIIQWLIKNGFTKSKKI